VVTLIAVVSERRRSGEHETQGHTQFLHDAFLSDSMMLMEEWTSRFEWSGANATQAAHAGHWAWLKIF
jgi:hypothetical protein